MENLSKNQKQEIVDFFGKTVIEDVRDDSLKFSMGIVNQATNPVKREQYKIFETLTNEQKEAVCDLLSETITNSIYCFLEMFEEHENEMELLMDCQHLFRQKIKGHCSGTSQVLNIPKKNEFCGY